MAVETMKEDKGGAAQALEFHTGIALNFRQTHAWVCASEDPECFDITMFKFKVYSLLLNRRHVSTIQQDNFWQLFIVITQ